MGILAGVVRAAAAIGRSSAARQTATATVRAGRATGRFLFGKKYTDKLGNPQRTRGAIQHALDRGWQIDNLEEYVKKKLPAGRNVFYVKVTGQPQANLNSLFEFAVSAAFGALPPYSSISACHFLAAIDHKNKIVEVTITFGVAGLMSFLFAGDLRTMMTRKVPSTIFASGTWPSFLFGPWSGTPPTITNANGIVVTDTPGSNPSLAFGNGTRGYNNTVAQAAPLKPTICSPVPIPSNQGPIGGQAGAAPGTALTPAQLQLIQTLFGM